MAVGSQFLENLFGRCGREELWCKYKIEALKACVCIKEHLEKLPHVEQALAGVFRFLVFKFPRQRLPVF